MADVFISHTHSAGEIARRIADDFAKNGISCWYAERDMKPGQFAGVITRAIRDCKIFLLIWNKEANHSEYIKSELSLALRQSFNYENITLLPFRVDDSDMKQDDLKYYLRGFHVIDGCPPDERHILELRKRVFRILGRGKNTPEVRFSQRA